MKKKDQKSTGLLIGAVAAGVVDVLLVVLLVFSFLVKTGQGEELKAERSEEFTENAAEYGQNQTNGEYTAQETVQYTSGVVTSQENEQADAADQSDKTEDGNASDSSTDVEGDLYEGFVFPDSNVVALTDSRIQETVTSASLCRRAINEIYARHGYAFTKQENTDYFNQYEWYKNMTKESDMSKVAGQFSSIEKANVEKLQAYENSQGWN